MFHSTSRPKLLWVVVVLVLAALACNANAGTTPTEETETEGEPEAAEGAPTTVIDSPPSGSSAAVGENVTVQSTSTDDVGVARVDLQVDGVVVRSDTTPDPAGQPQYALLQDWVPDTPGDYTLTVIAYRADGTAGNPASLTITIEEATEAEQSDEPAACMLRANTDVNVRLGPGVAYDVQRVLTIGTSEEVTGHNGDRTWYQVGGTGWISAPYVTLSGDCDAVQTANFPPPPSGGSSGSGGSGGSGPTMTPSYTATTNPDMTPTYTVTPGGPTLTPTTDVSPTPSYTPTMEANYTIAPDDNNYSLEVNFKDLGVGGSSEVVQGDVSYPEGDNTDTIFVRVVGFDSVTTSTELTFTLTCTGDVAAVQTNGVNCNSGTTRFFTNVSNTANFTIEITSGDGAYAQWTLVITAP